MSGERSKKQLIKERGCMFRYLLSFFLEFVVIFILSLPSFIHAADWELRQAESIARQQAGMYQLQDFGVNNLGYDGLYYGPYAYPSPIYDPYYGAYNSNYPYSTFPSYPNPYIYSNYRSMYYNPGMYNPNTNFINSPSRLNYPTGYPMYSETYIYP